MEKNINFFLCCKYFFYKIPAIIAISNPAAFILGTFWVQAHLIKRGEVAAFYGIGGLSRYRFIAIIVLFSLIVGCFHFLIAEFVAPYTNKLAIKIKDSRKEGGSLFLSLGRSKFLYFKRYEKSKEYLFEPKLMIFNAKQHLSSYWSAKAAKYSKEKKRWLLSGVVWRHLSPEGRVKEEKKYNKWYSNQLPPPAILFSWIKISKKVKDKPTIFLERIPMVEESIFDLYHYLKLKDNKDNKEKFWNRLKVEYHYRFSIIPKYIGLGLIIGSIITILSLFGIFGHPALALSLAIIFSFLYFSLDGLVLNIAWNSNSPYSFIICWSVVAVLIIISIFICLIY